MASVCKDKNGCKRILFFNHNRERKTIYLGRVTAEQAKDVKRYVEKLVAAKITDAAPDDGTSRWVAAIGDELHEKLAVLGLATPRKKADASTLAAYLDDYIDGRADVKPNTRAHLIRARNDLVDYFGAKRLLSTINAGDAEEWYRWLALPKTATVRKQNGRGLGENTARRIAGRAKQFFRFAKSKKLVVEDPFALLKDVQVQASEGRYYHVTREETDKVLRACPDAQWRLLFALSRYGGLRCPSEHLALRWGDVDWGRNRITVHSPKTEHIKGKSEREIPLFPELRPHLQAVLDELLDDFDPKANRLSEQPVITRYRDRNCNLRTQLCKIIRRAGLAPWPKLFQNLRANRATELAGEYPPHVVARWLGHSIEVSDKHYLQVLDENLAKAAHKAAHFTPQYVGTGRQASEQKCENPGDFEDRRDSVVLLAPPVGLEPTTQRLTAACSTN